MYQYNDFDRQFVNERVAHYRDQTQRFLNGDLSEDEFLQLRLRNGLYIQRLAPMLRVAIPYGTLSTAQLRALASIANTYDRGYGHLSTRQNMHLTGRRLPMFQTFWNSSPPLTCTQSKPVAVVSAMSPRITLRALRLTNPSTPALTAN